MRPAEFVRTLHRADPVLSVTGWFHVALLAAMLCIAPWDSRTVLGLNPWIKPMKFAASITLYVWTLGWYLRYLPGPRRALAIIRGGVALAMVAEIVCIATQGARGTTSHYNTATPFDQAVFAVMGIMILVNSLLALWTLLLFLTERVEIAAAYRMGIRFGLALFVIGSLEGMIMILNQAHTIGLADGGPGLPFLNWSTQAGDLRAAHAVGLHGLQILPLAGYALSRRPGLSPTVQLLLLSAAAVLYVGVLSTLFRQAAAGRPMIAL